MTVITVTITHPATIITPTATPTSLIQLRESIAVSIAAVCSMECMLIAKPLTVSNRYIDRFTM